ncbi:DUF6687 family protein [Chengkuizengella axinellae]|uniref:Uncharacterized protein n=1 Tax=Chengkuizengella axinellae TaxID=3064388 RepID=A0ABT9IX02_9BACL|nr:DUF6687 family protein [Chengkuizengella sp. 2205SS18-9]MDP5273877.1 hypothetical protein [Chengkuizengella sp. 2205SS18-9]
MIPNFYIIGSETERPPSKKTIFTDGAPDNTFREGVDIELSHWIPNQTPDIYRADTSTEICMNFVAKESSKEWDLAINNHLDVDGILSVFTLVHSEFALKHRNTIIGAAEIGDFWGYSERSSQILFQGLTKLMFELKGKEDIKEIYAVCFDNVFELIEKETSYSVIINGLEALQKSLNRVKSEEIQRRIVSEHFVSYQIPKELVEKDLEKAIKIPRFNDLLQDNMWLIPSVRNYYDREKVQLVSAETAEGWYYDLWYPGYMWADTPHSWRAPGFEFSGSTNAYYYGHEPLNDAITELNHLEKGAGQWILAKQLSPFQSIEGRDFPVILSFLNEDKPSVSSISPSEVISKLSKAF